MSVLFTMRSFARLLVSHRLIIVAAILLSALVVSPVLSFPLISRPWYKGINIGTVGGANVHEYLARGKEILEGHGLGSALLREGKNDPDYYFSISEYILVEPIRWLGLADRINIVTLYNIENFTGVFILLLLIYAFVYQLSKNKLLSTLVALSVVGGYSIIYNKQLFYYDFNIYERMIYPLMGSIFFFLYLNTLTKALSSSLSIYVLLASIALGLLFYIYFFAWTTAVVIVSLLAVLYALKKDWVQTKKVLVVLGLGLFIGLYNLYRIAVFVYSPDGQRFSYFSWLVHERSFIFSKIGFATIILFSFFYYRNRTDKNAPLLLAMILSGWITLNQQMITGKLLQYGHYYWFFIVPLSIVAGWYIVWSFIRGKRTQKILAGMVITIIFLNTAIGQYRSFLGSIPARFEEQQYQPLINYFNEEKQPVVILAADEIEELLFTIYTPHDLWWGSFAFMDTTPLERARIALYVYLYLNKEARADVANYLKKIMSDPAKDSFYKDIYAYLEGYDSGQDYYIYDQKFKHNEQLIGEKRAATIQAMAEEYKKFLPDNNHLQEILVRYGVRYIVWDRYKHPEWDLSVISSLEKVFSSGTIGIYRINV